MEENFLTKKISELEKRIVTLRQLLSEKHATIENFVKSEVSLQMKLSNQKREHDSLQIKFNQLKNKFKKLHKEFLEERKRVRKKDEENIKLLKQNKKESKASNKRNEVKKLTVALEKKKKREKELREENEGLKKRIKEYERKEKLKKKMKRKSKNEIALMQKKLEEGLENMKVEGSEMGTFFTNESENCKVQMGAMLLRVGGQNGEESNVGFSNVIKRFVEMKEKESKKK